MSVAPPPSSSERDSYDVVALASSAGGITALTKVLGLFPHDFPVPVLVVQPLDPRHETVLADVLGRRTQLAVTFASAGTTAQPGGPNEDSRPARPSWTRGAAMSGSAA